MSFGHFYCKSKTNQPKESVLPYLIFLHQCCQANLTNNIFKPGNQANKTEGVRRLHIKTVLKRYYIIFYLSILCTIHCVWGIFFIIILYCDFFHYIYNHISNNIIVCRIYFSVTFVYILRIFTYLLYLIYVITIYFNIITLTMVFVCWHITDSNVQLYEVVISWTASKLAHHLR